MRYSLGIAVALLAAARGMALSPAAQTPATHGPSTLVVCAPGYPGSTEEAQPAMDTLAAAISAAAGWKPGELKAVYYETEAGGVDRIVSGDAAVALVPLPCWLKHGRPLKLEAFMQAVEENGQPAEPWTLVAPTGQVKTSSDLAGFELASVAGYAPGFVRGPALSAWGELPRDVKITYSTAILTALRRASTGAKVALLLDRAQAAALPTLPFAAKLTVVAASAPLPVAVLSTVAGKVPAARQKALTAALASLGKTPAGAEALAGVRLSRFVPADQAALARAREAYERFKN